mgnify:CR=1 FL=1|tara:strand:+ start:206 stop:1663 length:1458 start_codon:yes stop_codon:yes gene_type:complete
MTNEQSVGIHISGIRSGFEESIFSTFEPGELQFKDIRTTLFRQNEQYYFLVKRTAKKSIVSIVSRDFTDAVNRQDAYISISLVIKSGQCFVESPRQKLIDLLNFYREKQGSNTISNQFTVNGLQSVIGPAFGTSSIQETFRDSEKKSFALYKYRDEQDLDEQLKLNQDVLQYSYCCFVKSKIDFDFNPLKIQFKNITSFEVEDFQSFEEKKRKAEARKAAARKEKERQEQLERQKAKERLEKRKKIFFIFLFITGLCLVGFGWFFFSEEFKGESSPIDAPKTPEKDTTVKVIPLGDSVVVDKPVGKVTETNKGKALKLSKGELKCFDQIADKHKEPNKNTRLKGMYLLYLDKQWHYSSSIPAKKESAVVQSSETIGILNNEYKDIIAFISRGEDKETKDVVSGDDKNKPIITKNKVDKVAEYRNKLEAICSKKGQDIKNNQEFQDDYKALIKKINDLSSDDRNSLKNEKFYKKRSRELKQMIKIK